MTLLWNYWVLRIYWATYGFQELFGSDDGWLGYGLICVMYWVMDYEITTLMGYGIIGRNSVFARMLSGRWRYCGYFTGNPYPYPILRKMVLLRIFYAILRSRYATVRMWWGNGSNRGRVRGGYGYRDRGESRGKSKCRVKGSGRGRVRGKPGNFYAEHAIFGGIGRLMHI